MRLRGAVPVFLCGLVLSLSGCGRGSPAASVSEAPAQTIAGFGASGAWWPLDLGWFSPANQERAANLLFGPQGMELSVYRYNIGAGGLGVRTPSRAAPGFLERPGVYDWTADPSGLTFLRYAAAAHVPVLIGFANSAPPVWKTPNARTHQREACGGGLAPGDEEAYAQYLADIAVHLHDADGITLGYISPMNEPDYTFDTCDQEGMTVAPAQRAVLIRDLAAQLQSRAPYTRIIADESSQVSRQLLPEAPRWLPQVAGDIAAIAHHTYDYPNSATLRRAAAVLGRYGRPLWMTEICCYNGKGFGRGYDPTMTGAMWLADDIWRDLTQADDASFQWWLAFSSALGCDPTGQAGCPSQPNARGWNDGLVYYDPNFRLDGNQTLYLTKRFWVLGNFSRYVRPGAVRHDVSGVPAGLRVAAFATTSGWTVVAINDRVAGTAPVTLRLRFPAGSHPHAVGAFQTSASRDLQAVRLPSMHGGTMRDSLPPESVTTFLLGR